MSYIGNAKCSDPMRLDYENKIHYNAILHKTVNSVLHTGQRKKRNEGRSSEVSEIDQPFEMESTSEMELGDEGPNTKPNAKKKYKQRIYRIVYRDMKVHPFQEGDSSDDEPYENIIVTEPIPLNGRKANHKHVYVAVSASNPNDYKFGAGEYHNRIYVLSAGVKQRTTTKLH